MSAFVNSNSLFPRQWDCAMLEASPVPVVSGIDAPTRSTTLPARLMYPALAIPILRHMLAQHGFSANNTARAAIFADGRLRSMELHEQHARHVDLNDFYNPALLPCRIQFRTCMVGRVW